MRLLLSMIFFLLAAWQTYKDWQATMAVDQQFRFASVEEAWIAVSPDTHAQYLPKMQESTIPMLWDPILVNLMTFPAAIVLFAISVFFWLIRKKKEYQKMNYIE
jgi:hypothetical protein